MRSTNQRRSRKSRLLALSAAAVSQALLARYMTSAAWAGPKGAQVARGHVTITQNGDTTIIHASNNSIINFAGFNIAQGESVQIIEPSARSRVLERIIGGGPTLIDGNLTANGQLFIVNPGGINFGADAHVNVGGLTAVAGNLSNADFIAGVNHFTNVNGSIVNQGQIVSGGATVLAGAQIASAGTISAGPGTVVLAAGNDVYVGTHGSSIYAKVSGGSSSLVGNVAGSGDIYSLALGRASRVSGNQIVVNGGGGNVQVSGSLDASSTSGAGGSVSVTGGNVQLTGATINASGPVGGGSIHIGGDAHGAGVLQTAATTSISTDSILHADATLAGNGGSIVIWSDNLTNFSGLVTTRGAGASGLGGAVEISSGGNLVFNGYADRYGLAGGGLLLLDPATITIDAPTAAGIVTALGSGPVSEIATTEIFVTASFDISAQPNSLTLNAPTIDLSGGITDTPGQLIGAGVTTVDLHNGGFVQNAVDLLPASGGALNVDGSYSTTENVSISKQITLTNIAGNAAGTAATADSWTASQPITLAGAFATTGHGAFNLNNAVQLGGDVLLSAPGGGQIVFGGTLNGAHNLELNSGGATEQFQGIVGGTARPTSILIDASGGATTIGANISTASGQTYGDAVTLSGAAITLNDSGGAITFSSTITGAGTALTASSSGGNTFDGTVVVKSLSESGGGGATLGGNVTTTLGQTYADAVTLTGAAQTVTDGVGVITFSSTVTGTGTALTAAGAGAHVFDGKVNVQLLNTTGGALTLGGDVSTTAGQTYADAVTLTGATQTLNDTAGQITFSSTITGAGTALSTSGAAGNIFDGAVNVKSLNESGGTGATLSANITTTAGQTYADAVTLTGASRTVTDSAGAITFSSSVTGASTALTSSGAGGNIFDSGATVKSLVTTGAGGTTLGGNVTTTAGQTYGDAVTLTGAALTVTDSVGTITFSSTITGAGTALTSSGAAGNIFDGKVIVQSLNATGGGGTTLGADVTTTAGQTYVDAVTLTGAGLTVSDNAGQIEFSSTVTGTGTNLTASAAGGNLFDTTVHVKSLTASGAAGTTLSGNVTTTAGQTYVDAVTLTIPTETVTDSVGAITFSSTVTGTGTALTASGAGGNIFDGKATLQLLTTTGAGGTSLGSDVTTTAGQTYGDAVTLTGTPQTLTDSSGIILFTSTVTGTGSALTTSGAGGNIFGGAVNIQSLNESGGTGATLSGNVTTSAGQTYADAVTLTGAARTVTDSAGVIEFSSTVTGTSTALTASGAGGNVFDALVTVQSLHTTGAGGTTLNDDVTTTAGQTYGDAVTLTGASRSLTDTVGIITFSSTLTGTGTALNALGAGGNIFDGKTTILSLNAVGAGGTTLGADVTTTQGQTYADAVTLTGAGLTVSDNAGQIEFSSTVTGTGTSLTASAVGGNLFDAAVNVKSLSTSGAAGTTLNGNVTTTAGQTYADSVTLTTPTELLTDATGAITFSSTVTGAGTALTSSGAGGNIFDDVVTVQSLSTTGAGGTTLGADVSTSAGQTYGDAVTLTGATQLLVDTAETITFTSTLTGTGTALTVTGPGGDIFDGTVKVQSLTADGNITLAGNVTTTAGQTYVDAVTLVGASRTVTDSAGIIEFSSTVTGTGTALTASGAGGNVFDGLVTVKSLSTTGAGGTTLNDDVTTTAGQTYGDAVTLTGATRALTDATGAITFSSTVSGTGSALISSGAAGNIFDGIATVQSLSTTGAGGTTLGSDVTTTAGQTYGDAVTLTGTTQTLTDSSGIILFTGAITGTGSALTTSGAGGNIFDGAVNIKSLNESGGTGATLSGNVTTTAGQTYADAVTLTGASRTVTDSAGIIEFSSTVTGTSTALTASGAGGNVFDGLVTVQSLHTTGAGGTTLGADVTTTAGQTYGDAVSLTGATQNLTDSVGTITFSSTVTGTGTALNASGAGGNIFDGNVTVLSLNATGATTLGADVTTTAGQTYVDAVTLTGAALTVSDNAGQIEFSSTVTGTGTSLTASAAGGNLFDSTVKVKLLSASGAAGTTLGGNVTTTAGQTYADAVTLTAPTETVTDATGAITFSSTVTGTGTALTSSGASGNIFDDIVTVQSLSTTGAGGTTLGSDVTTTAGQTYGDAVSLTGTTQTLTDSSGIILFTSTVTGTGSALTTSGAGGNIFDGAVNIKSLNESGGTGATLGGNVTTTAGQTYADAVTLTGASRTVTDGTGAIEFSSTVFGTSTALTASGAGGNIFDALVTVKSLHTTGAGGTTLNDDVTTTAGQTYGDAVTLTGATRTFTDTTGAITFSSTVTGASTALTSAGAGGNIFDGKVTLLSLSATGAGGTTLGADVSTSAGQTYADAVTLTGAGLTVTDTAGEIIFSSTITGTGTALTASAAGGNFFDGTVKAKSLNESGGAGVTLGGNVTTTAGQTYADAVTLTGAVQTFTDATGAITFSSTVTGATTALVSSGAGGNIFDALVTLKSLSATGAGGTTLKDDVTTTAGQTYADAVTLTGASRTFTDATGAITFSSSVTGAGTALTTSGAGGNIFDGAVIVQSLLTNGAGGTTLAGSVTTTAGQTYADAVTLGGASVHLTDATGAITFSSTITGTGTSLSASGAAGNFFDAAVDAKSLSVDGPAGTTLAGNVTTTAGQTFADAVTLTGAARSFLDATGAITFSSTVTGTGTVLTASGAGGNIFDDIVSVQSLHTTGAHGTTLGNDVSTTAGQTYGDAVTLTGDQLLVDPSGVITFTSSLTGPATALIVSGADGNIFDGPVDVLSLKVIGAGGTTLGGSVTTAHGQTYTDAVSLIGSTVNLTDPSGSITFDFAVTGAATDLTANGAGGNFFDAAVTVRSFTAQGAGGTTLGAGVTTSAGQTYEDSVTFPSGAENLTDTGGVITFQVDVNDSATDLFLDALGGEVFDGNVILHSLHTSAAGSATFAADVTTIAGQTYLNNVKLTGTDQTFSDSVGIIDFENGINGPLTNLSVFGTGGNVFKGTITLKSLNVGGAGGTTVIGVVTTTNGQTYGDALTLGPPSGVLNDLTTITFDGTIAGTGHVSAKNLDTHGQVFTIGTILFQSDTPSNLSEFTDANFSTTNGGRSLELATVIAGAITFVAPPPVITPPALTASERKDLELLGIYVREKERAEADKAILGDPSSGIIIIDWPPKPLPLPSERRVTTVRLFEQRVKQIVTLTEEVFGHEFADSRKVTDQIAAGLADYRDQMKPADGKVTPQAFVDFVLSHQQTPAEKSLLETLRSMRQLMDRMGDLGLSPVELENANKGWTGALAFQLSDSNVVDPKGDFDIYWVLHVLQVLPSAPAQ